MNFFEYTNVSLTPNRIALGLNLKDFEKLLDEYLSLIIITPNGFVAFVGVRYRGDKDKIDFEMLEGRRAYLDRLCKQIIATAKINLGKRGFND